MIPDTAFSIAFDLNAPAPERYDAQAEIQKAHAPRSSNSLIPSEHVRQFIDYMQAHREAHDDFLKAHEFPGRVIPPPKVGPRSVMLNHQQITVSGQFYEKPGPLGFDALRTIVARTPMLSSIILTRQRQVSRFCQPSDDGKLGFEICLKDPKAQRTPDDEAFIQRMTRFFTNCGDETNPRARKRLKRSNFAQLMMKSVEDTLTMDSNPIETEFKRDRSRGLSGIYAIDGATIRLCTEEGYEGDDEVIAVQVVDGVPMAAY
ncbi:MAG: hypothetical protein E7K72_27275, partial [Roseomonas mucosa]|nr:hypothetical protein [Roseomonas mucosa]